MSIIAFIFAVSCDDDGTFNGYTGEETSCPAVGVNRCLGRDRNLSIATNRSGSDARVYTERDVTASGERAHGIPIIENKDEVGHFAANLRLFDYNGYNMVALFGVPGTQMPATTGPSR